MAGIFISYRRSDTAGYAGRLREDLERRLGTEQVFRDADTIRPGQDFVQAIDAGLAGCSAMLVLIGDDWLGATNAAGQRRLGLDDDYVTLEVAGALKRPELLVIPVLVEGTRMPTAEALPPPIRELAKRQAISLRDEAWSADVDRLASVLKRVSHERSAPRPRLVTLLSAAAVVVALAMVVAFAGRFRATGASSASGVSATDSRGARSGGSSSEGTGTGYRIEVPPIAEFADGSVTHTVLSASVTRRGDANLLAVRIRFGNDGRSGANFWNSSYRLLAGEQTLAPVGDLNEVVPSQAARDGIVTFEVPAAAQNVRFRVESKQDPPGTLPLDLARQNRGSDAATQALVRRIAEGDDVLASGPSGSITLIRATSRRFVNTLRVTFTMRMINATSRPALLGSGAVRALVDGMSHAPIDSPSEAVEGHSSSPPREFVFDLPPATARLVLRTTFDDKVAEKPFEVNVQ